jgi:hypothetical protein
MSQVNRGSAVLCGRRCRWVENPWVGPREPPCHRSDGLYEKVADRLVDAGTGKVLADRFAVLDALALANVVRMQTSPPAVVTNSHPFAAAPADQQPLQQRRSFSRRTLAPVLAIGLGSCPGDAADSAHIRPSRSWCSNSPPNFKAPTATFIPAYTGRMTFANQSTRFKSEFQVIPSELTQ